MGESDKRYYELLCLLKDRIPNPQFREIQLRPCFNPRLDPQPSSIFNDCFEWYIALPLIQGGRYGPFYRIDGEHFWPQHSDGKNPLSEAKYFFGLEKPENLKDAEAKYSLVQKQPAEGYYVHEFTIDPKSIEHSFGRPEIYVGPVKNGSGYQGNPNIPTAEIIRSLIVKKETTAEKLPS